MLKKGGMLSPSFGHLVKNILSSIISLRSFSLSHTVRHDNAVAHALT